MSTAPMYTTHGPVQGQDGRPVFTVVRLLPGRPCSPAQGLAVAEALSQAMEDEHAHALNQAAAQAAAQAAGRCIRPSP